MGHARRVQSQEVTVLGENDPPLCGRVGDLLLVGRAAKANFRGRGHVDAATPQAFGDRPVAILIQVEPDCPRHQGFSA
jgi:hypothetical protein